MPRNAKLCEECFFYFSFTLLKHVLQFLPKSFCLWRLLAIKTFTMKFNICTSLNTPLCCVFWPANRCSIHRLLVKIIWFCVKTSFLYFSITNGRNRNKILGWHWPLQLMSTIDPHSCRRCQRPFSLQFSSCPFSGKILALVVTVYNEIILQYTIVYIYFQILTSRGGLEVERLLQKLHDSISVVQIPLRTAIYIYAIVP